MIAAMVNKSRQRLMPAQEAAPAPIVLSDVNEIGVYYKDHNGKWQEIDPETVRIKSGGWLKSTATHGIIKEDRNGHINGREAKLLLPRPVELLISAPDGVDVSEYDVLRFRLNSDSREFRALTGGVFHSTSGDDRDKVTVHPVRVAPHTWTFTLDAQTPGGEYGVLPPGTGNVANGGKAYTFAVTEGRE